MQRDRRKWRGAAVAAVLVALGGAAPATAATASRHGSHGVSVDLGREAGLGAEGRRHRQGHLLD